MSPGLSDLSLWSVTLPLHHVIAADDAEAIVESKEGLACACKKNRADCERRQKAIYHHKGFRETQMCLLFQFNS